MLDISVFILIILLLIFVLFKGTYLLHRKIRWLKRNPTEENINEFIQYLKKLDVRLTGIVTHFELNEMYLLIDNDHNISSQTKSDLYYTLRRYGLEYIE